MSVGNSAYAAITLSFRVHNKSTTVRLGLIGGMTITSRRASTEDRFAAEELSKYWKNAREFGCQSVLPPLVEVRAGHYPRPDWSH